MLSAMHHPQAKTFIITTQKKNANKVMRSSNLNLFNLEIASCENVLSAATERPPSVDVWFLSHCCIFSLSATARPWDSMIHSARYETVIHFFRGPGGRESGGIFCMRVTGYQEHCPLQEHIINTNLPNLRKKNSSGPCPTWYPHRRVRNVQPRGTSLPSWTCVCTVSRALRN